MEKRFFVLMFLAVVLVSAGFVLGEISPTPSPSASSSPSLIQTYPDKIDNIEIVWGVKANMRNGISLLLESRKTLHGDGSEISNFYCNANFNRPEYKMLHEELKQELKLRFGIDREYGKDHLECPENELTQVSKDPEFKKKILGLYDVSEFKEALFGIAKIYSLEGGKSDDKGNFDYWAYFELEGTEPMLSRSFTIIADKNGQELFVYSSSAISDFEILRDSNLKALWISFNPISNFLINKNGNDGVEVADIMLQIYFDSSLYVNGMNIQLVPVEKIPTIDFLLVNSKKIPGDVSDEELKSSFIDSTHICLEYSDENRHDRVGIYRDATYSCIIPYFRCDVIEPIESNRYLKCSFYCTLATNEEECLYERYNYISNRIEENNIIETTGSFPFTILYGGQDE